MPGITPAISPPADGFPKVDAPAESQAVRPGFGAWADATLRPNFLVRWAFYLSIFSIPFSHLYLPGTGERVGVTRLVQALILCAVLSQPRVCVRLIPVALFWLLAYCALRIFDGLYLTPDLSSTWWPTTFKWIQFSLPWVWVMFNVLRFPNFGRSGLWALAWGCSVCAMFHMAGIGVIDVDNGVEGRSTVFDQNANEIGFIYAIAIVALVGLGMLKTTKPVGRLLAFGLIALVGAGLAKTGCRTGILIVAIGTATLLFDAEAFIPRTRRYASLLVLAAMLGLVLYLMPSIVQRLEKVDSPRFSQQEGRVRMLPVLWEMFLRSPIYGSGPDRYQFELTRRAMPYLIRDQKTISAHNMVLFLLVETGVIGFLFVGIGLWKVLAAAWRARLGACGVLPLALILPLIVSGLTVGNPINHQIFWLAIAYALAGAA